jgi:predicted PurR-regulated permease PerM
MRIQNPFQLGLLGGLGVLLALVIGGAVGSLATIITYVVAALFIALGIDPLVSFLEKHRWPRWLAILVVLIGVLGVLAGLVFALVPVIVEQIGFLVSEVTRIIDAGITYNEIIEQLQAPFDPTVIDIGATVQQGIDYVSSNIGAIGAGVLGVGLAIANGAFGALIVLILTLYFVASLDSMKRGLLKLVPASRRKSFGDITEQVSTAVGRYVVGQVSLAAVNGILSLIYLSIIGAAYPALFAFIAFLFSLIPLVGTISGSIVIVLVQLLVNPDSLSTVIAAGVYYLVYMQVEAYLLSPNIMNRAVKVPGVVVVLAALTGGTLLGILGALIAVPVAASILIVINQVVIPKQNAR